jgi:3-hydroxyacyl-CoA dehydrogenase
MGTIRRVAVLGAGTMGSRIAAHFANAGVPSRLLDIVVPGEPDRSVAARRGLEAAARQRPNAFFTESARSLILPGNFEDNLADLGDCDWIIEAVTEQLDVKRAIWERVNDVRKADAILSTNTSGLPLARICEGFPHNFQSRFLGTHFFNPPRYLHLVEVIPTRETDEETVRFVTEFCEVRLGKGVVRCKDTPNFIANRIGSFYGSTVYKLTTEEDFTIEEVDALTGPLIGLPKTASYRLLDVVGLDVWSFVSKNLHDLVPHDPWRDRFTPPPFLEQMLERKWLGDKTGQGFYKRVGPDRQIHVIDWRTLEYHPAQKVTTPLLAEARRIEDLPRRLQMLVASDDRAGRFLWKLFSDVFLYSAERIPEIADRVVEIDNAMRWGYAHSYGPFELWDALGFAEVCDRIEQEGRELPRIIQDMREAGAKTFYRMDDSVGTPGRDYFGLGTKKYVRLEGRPGVLVLADWKRAKGVVRSNAAASLIDLDDGVLCCEFHSKANSIDEDVLTMLRAGLDETERNYRAMILANRGENFSAGANLQMLLQLAQARRWDEMNLAIDLFQTCNMAMKYAPKPVVAAPFQRVLGGAAELVLHCTRSQASAELYMGLVEVGVGLIPAAGGCKEMIARLRDPRKVFELIGTAKVSTSAEDARNLGLLRKTDNITMNPERLIADAKRLALSLVPTHAPGLPSSQIRVGGEGAYAAMKFGAWSMKEAGYISDHDFVIAEKLAYVLSGGRLPGESNVSEQHLLDLEREAFLSLCGEAKTQQRIEHMLKHGQPLRN